MRLLIAGALSALVAPSVACSSDSGDDAGKGGAATSGSSSGGTSSNDAGKGANDAGKASGTGATSSGKGGDSPAGGAPDEGGGAASEGGSASGTAGSSSAGSSSAGSSGSGAGTLPGDNVWNCLAGGTSCICQNNGDPKNANTCTGTYKCCFAVPLGNSTRCQCQDPYTSKCSDLAGAFGPSGKVVDHCPPDAL